MLALAQREIDPPAMLAEAIIGSEQPRTRRLLPIPPVPPNELIRVIGENRDAIASAAGAAVVVAGAAWILWRASGARRGATVGQ
jgi:hypothetical protein